MKYIDKTNSAPTRLTTWKTYHDTTLQRLYTSATGKVIWEYLDNNKTIDGTANDPYSKDELKTTLIEEQGHICCYCGKRIKNDHKAVIEHLHPKSIHKDRAYDYTNLLISCDGGVASKIHIVQQGETLGSIAQDYGVSEEYLLDVYIDTPTSIHINKLTQLYDIENLNVGDRLFIIPYINPKLHHCDTRKKSQQLQLHPTQLSIESHFKYLADGNIDISVSTQVEDTVDKLGLNLLPILVQERKSIIDAAKQLKRAILTKVGSNLELYQQAIQQASTKYYTKNSEGQFAPYAFVTVAVLNA